FHHRGQNSCSCHFLSITHSNNRHLSSSPLRCGDVVFLPAATIQLVLLGIVTEGAVTDLQQLRSSGPNPSRLFQSGLQIPPFSLGNFLLKIHPVDWKTRPSGSLAPPWKMLPNSRRSDPATFSNSLGSSW